VEKNSLTWAKVAQGLYHDCTASIIRKTLIPVKKKTSLQQYKNKKQEKHVFSNYTSEITKEKKKKKSGFMLT
jgi:hypothetical protein